MSVTVERTAPDVLMVRDAEVTTDWERWYLLKADTHWDNPLCDRPLLERLHRQARERGARIIEAGDLFCLMQGKYDPRADKAHVRPEHQQDDYLGAVEDTAVDYFAPWADLYLQISDGNHDTAILKRHEYDILGRFCRRLGIQRGPYAGWILFRFEHPNGSGHRTTRRLYYHHGWGGGGPVTKGTINPSRVATYTPDADIVLYGHIHEQWLFPIERQRISDSGKRFFDRQYHIQLPTMKQEFVGGGYHIEKGRPPKPLGAWWLRFYYTPRKAGCVGMDIRMAED
jgi:hypothetical protein